MSPNTESQLLIAFDAMRDRFDAQIREMGELRIRLERVIAEAEAREAVCRITHDALNARLKRHSDGLSVAREQHISLLEDELENTKTGLKAPHKESTSTQVTVARWAALSAIAVALLTGGLLTGLAKVVVAALAHAMGLGG